MRIDWKSELKKNLEKQDLPINTTAINCGKGVITVNRSSDFKEIPEKNSQSNKNPHCSNCNLEMKLIENNTLWFCPLGCTKKRVAGQGSANKNGSQTKCASQITQKIQELTEDEKNEQNKFIASVNEKLEIVKNDADLLDQFNTILDEQKAILIINGGRSEIEAESIISKPENVRSVVLSL